MPEWRYFQKQKMTLGIYINISNFIYNSDARGQWSQGVFFKSRFLSRQEILNLFPDNAVSILYKYNMLTAGPYSIVLK